MELPPGAAQWAQLSLSEWDRLFAPSNHLQEQPGQPGEGAAAGLYSHDFLIHPVSGGCNYTRRCGPAQLRACLPATHS